MGTEYKVQSAECKVQFLSALFFFCVIPWLDHGIQVMGLVATRPISHSLDRHGRVAPSRWQDIPPLVIASVAKQSSQLYCRAATHIFYSIQHLLAQISLITWIPWSSHGMTIWRKTRPRMTKRIQNTKNPHMIIFSLQDMWQTNKINTKHVPNPNHRLD